jgi:protein O-GlcNAc transferase
VVPTRGQDLQERESWLVSFWTLIAVATIGEWFDMAVRCHQSGDPRLAAALCRRILQINPDHAPSHQLLGIAEHQTGRPEAAIASLRRAIALNPADSGGHVNLGLVLRHEGKPTEAAMCFRQALLLEPTNATVSYHLANILRDQGHLKDAEFCYQQAIAFNPGHADAHVNLGIILKQQGHLAEAASCYRRALAVNPQHAHAHNNLGNALYEMGQAAEALECYRQALRIDPHFVDAHHNLGAGLFEQGDLPGALECYRQALRINPHLDEAHNNLGILLKDQAQLDEALACFQRARDLRPENHAYHSAFLATVHYHPRYDARTIFEEHQRWDLANSQWWSRSAHSFANDPAPERCLRIGYVSPDFRDHVLGRNIWPLLKNHDRGQFEIALYANQTCADWMTARFQSCAGIYRGIAGLTDDRVAEIIAHDGIDILVDLALHTVGNRLPVFARKPAPVQVTFAGYPGTTGLRAMDYRLTDPYLDPPGLRDASYAETSFRLPNSFWCFDPQTEEPRVGPLPALARGFVSFGCINNFCKVNDAALELWSRVLSSLKGSRLLLLAKPGSHRRRTLDFLARQGIPGERVEFFSLLPRDKYLRYYHQIDIGLDTFPYNGHTSSLDALWMGVPVITLVGSTVVGRAGLSQLTNLGLEQLAAFTPDNYVRLATDLAVDLPRLDTLRSSLRDRLRQSPLMDVAGFTRGIEQAYRIFWRKWCARRLQIPGQDL